MSVDDLLTGLARLEAGLAEDEQAAQEAVSLEQPYRKLSDKGVYVTIRYEWVRHTKLSTGGRGSMFLDGAPDPQRVLRQVGAIRKVLAVCDAIDADALAGEWWEDKYGDHADEIREALASIYTESAEEG